MRIRVPLADLRDAPAGRLERQYAFGERVDVLGEKGGWHRVRPARDALEGWMAVDALGPDGDAPTHRVATLSAHVYPAPDIKAPPLMRLPFGARIAAGEGAGGEGAGDGDAAGGGSARFLRAEGGYVPRAQLRALDAHDADPVEVAERFLGVPYLWGGDGPDGIDCSGLVQAALLACGIRCPADSGPQERAFGGPPEGVEDAPRGALVFWRGHVAISRGDGTIVHANAGAMAVAIEGIAEAIGRIERAGEGRPTAMGLPTPPRG